MTTDTSTHRAPAPIVAAIAVTALIAAGFLAISANAIDTTDGQIVAAIGLGLGGLAFSIWKGWGFAQTTTVLIGGLLILGGLALLGNMNVFQRLGGLDNFAWLIVVVGALMAGLVLIPQSARDWFNRGQTTEPLGPFCHLDMLPTHDTEAPRHSSGRAGRFLAVRGQAL